MLHNVLIALHATGGSVAFVGGVLLLLFVARGATQLDLAEYLHLGGILLLLLALIAVVATDWPTLETVLRVAFTALLMLALYMAWRGVRAYQVLRDRGPGWRADVTDHVGFNLISLFEGLVIVAAIDLGASGWLVALVAVLGALVGNRLVHRVQVHMA